LARRLAAAAARLIALADPALVVLAGGDTAGATLELLGVRRLWVLRELLPGMPLARGADRAGHARLFALKAGAHGADDTLAELIRT
ncbi:MAG TPA: nucleotide-binding domain containing protein, partial [Roseiflexaceae bacterium]|nr:nucleotide-binding domain containing protein [Roseiflexaceae bacterium]